LALLDPDPDSETDPDPLNRLNPDPIRIRIRIRNPAFGVIFALLYPYPGSGSTDMIESGSNLDPDPKLLLRMGEKVKILCPRSFPVGVMQFSDFQL
jgi:hypothetical protein